MKVLNFFTHLCLFLPQVLYIFGISDFFLNFLHVQNRNPENFANFFPKKSKGSPPLDFAYFEVYGISNSHEVLRDIEIKTSQNSLFLLVTS